jgi:hypothetical protein
VSYERIHGVNLSQLVAVCNVEAFTKIPDGNWVQFLDLDKDRKDKETTPTIQAEGMIK